MYDRRQRLIEVFQDTQKYYTEERAAGRCGRCQQVGHALVRPG